nr:DUF2806 domain-containing protein [uncultured Desulfobacter sp.]
MADNSLINLGDLSKPVTILIEKIANATGILYEPTRIRRTALAETDAAKIKALASIEISDIQQRALTRFVEEEARKQQNIERITAESFSQIKDNARPEDIEDDWLTFFYDKCRNVSDVEMQSLWANLLAGEVNQPGRFSKRTLKFVSTLEKEEAHLFTRLCEFSVSNEHNFTVPLVFDLENTIYADRKINHDTLRHLDSIGLVSFGFQQEGFKYVGPQKLSFRYFDAPYCVEVTPHSYTPLGHIALTKIGMELAPICGAKKDEEVLNYFLQEFPQRGIFFQRLIDKKN